MISNATKVACEPQVDGDVRLRVLTYNLWGIFNSKIRLDRMRRFASKVGNYDVILLQEQFLEEDFEYIKAQLPEEVRNTRFFKRFPSSFYGSGCAVISRYPIESYLFHTFPLQGYPEMVLHGDFFANKGVALTRILVPNASGHFVPVRLYTTHLVAVYTKVSQLRDWRTERYLPYRISQAVSLAEFVSATSSPQDAIIIGGDFNCSPTSLEIQIMLIMLKKRGYQLQPALPRPVPIPPPPSSISVPQHSTGEDDEEHITWPETTPSSLDRSHANYTYADSNAYNTMCSSYFKLLKLQGDLPCQIDHLIVDTAHFEMESFDDCPDYEAPSIQRPSSPPGSSGVAKFPAPCAVVVLTRDEVPWPTAEQDTGLRHRCMLFLSRLSRGHVRAPSGAGDVMEMCCRDAARGGSAAAAEEQLFPISDHYGVASRLRLRSAAEASKLAHGDAANRQSVVVGAAIALTEEDVQVVEAAREVLGLTVERLRSQQYYSRAVACICGGLGAVALVQLLRDRRRHRRLIAVALGLLSKAVTFFNEGEKARSSRGLSSLLRATWRSAGQAVASVFHRGGSTAEAAAAGAASGPGAERLLANEINLQELASSLQHPMNPFYIVLLITTPIIGFFSFAIGLLHRLGNAKLFEEQLRTMERVCYGGISN